MVDLFSELSLFVQARCVWLYYANEDSHDGYEVEQYVRFLMLTEFLVASLMQPKK